jgi:hypothetical protein
VARYFYVAQVCAHEYSTVKFVVARSKFWHAPSPPLLSFIACPSQESSHDFLYLPAMNDDMLGDAARPPVAKMEEAICECKFSLTVSYV